MPPNNIHNKTGSSKHLRDAKASSSLPIHRVIMNVGFSSSYVNLNVDVRRYVAGGCISCPSLFPLKTITISIYKKCVYQNSASSKRNAKRGVWKRFMSNLINFSLIVVMVEPFQLQILYKEKITFNYHPRLFFSHCFCIYISYFVVYWHNE